MCSVCVVFLCSTVWGQLVLSVCLKCLRLFRFNFFGVKIAWVSNDRWLQKVLDVVEGISALLYKACKGQKWSTWAGTQVVTVWFISQLFSCSISAGFICSLQCTITSRFQISLNWPEKSNCIHFKTPNPDNGTNFYIFSYWTKYFFFCIPHVPFN